MIARCIFLIAATLAILIGASLPVFAWSFEVGSEPYAVPDQPKPKPKPQVRGFVQRLPAPKAEKPDPACAGIVTVVGDQYASEDGARKEAEKAWMQTARFQHGERFMDPAHARQIEFACGRSSVGSLVGQTFHRCEMSARACKAPRVSGDR